MDSLSICVLTYKRRDLLRDCLRSVVTQDLTDIDYELVVINNGWEPLKLHDDEIFYPMTQLIDLEENLGNVGGQNACFKLCDSEWILFISDDVRLQEGCIKSLWEERFHGQLMPIILNQDLTIQSYGGRLKWPGYGFNLMERAVTLDYIPSICYLMPRQLWENKGGFDEGFKGVYEDVDMGYRLCPDSLRCSLGARAIHLGNQTLGYINNEPFKRARVRFLCKHFTGIDQKVRRAARFLLDGIRG